MNLKYFSRTAAVIAVAVLILPGCKIRQAYIRPSVETDSLYRSVYTTDTTTIASLSWRQMFKDDKLQALIQAGIANNYDLIIAVARIKQAEANLRQAKAAFLPTLSVSPQYTRQKVAATQGGNLGFTPENVYAVQGNASWEIDLWGKLSSAKKASLASLLQSYAYQRSVQTKLIADIATDYYNLLAYDKQLAITVQTVKNRKEDVETNKALKVANRVNEASVAQSEANLYAAEVTIPDLQNSIRETENALCVLIGRHPGTIQRNLLDMQEVDTTLQTGLPAQLLSNRPDVQQAEYNVRYYFEQINVARAYFYPTLNITAQGGWQSATVGDLFKSATIFGNVVGGLTQPVFNKGLNKQRLQLAKAQYEENVATFQQTVLDAGREVSDALYNYKAVQDKASTRKLLLDAWFRSVDYNRELLKNGYVTYTDVLTSEQSYLSAQLSGVNDRLQQLTSLVTLYKSLGGGWK
ncbi:efflux transporter outer membrane subunit [Chitinophaga sancti]|uniref:efflux transporter outer membrane subunit n=1 Tax=Chitinophaga sancti TaxID=1004 RepID=UPI002A74A8FF|nr:efflux transporter outer membrane subunit [Chitinophaga sancti]WPQ61450.1 efflux transporter outer membrane subunit [Chitinophaga sancti]